MIAALVPVKRLGAGKSRLPLDRDASAALAQAMLEDVLAALRALPELDPVAVVTGDPGVAEAAAAAGARVLRHPEEGLNASIDAASAALSAEGATGVLVVLGDVAGVVPEDLRRLLAELDAVGGSGAVLAPSADGGTAALLRAPADAIASGFGPESAARHRELAREAGVPLRELALPSLAVDIDAEEDLSAFLARPDGGARTRAALARIGWRAPQ